MKATLFRRRCAILRLNFPARNPIARDGGCVCFILTPYSTEALFEVQPMQWAG